MANKRMFSSAVLESDAFLDLPPKSQNLYVHLNMRADDDGFASPKSVMRSAGCTALDLKHLVDANFVILLILAWFASLIGKKITQSKQTATSRHNIKKSFHV